MIAMTEQKNPTRADAAKRLAAMTGSIESLDKKIIDSGFAKRVDGKMVPVLQ